MNLPNSEELNTTSAESTQPESGEPVTVSETVASSSAQDNSNRENSSTASSSVTTERLPSGITIIRLGADGAGPVLLNEERLSSLEQSLKQLAADSSVKGLIIAGANPDMFCAGADVKLIQSVKDAEVGASLAARGQAVFNLIAQLPFPSIAAISGPCVGGGCELALACTQRICSDTKSTQIGLPEVRLGILPGFGGTQRLPRVVGVRKALDIILLGKTLRPKQALASGLVCKIVQASQMLGEAERMLLSKSIPSPRIPLADKLLGGTTLGRYILQSTTSKVLRRKTKGFYPAPPAALKSVINGLSAGNNPKGLEAGLKFEATELGRLITTPESKALVRIFFLTEAAKGLGKYGAACLKGSEALVVGAGVMGSGIARAIAEKGFPSYLSDNDSVAIERAAERYRGDIRGKSYLSHEERESALGRLIPHKLPIAQSGELLSRCRFAIEAVVETLEVKQQLFKTIAERLPEDAILATNTSSLSVTAIASEVPNPERVVGLHFFNPVEKMPLVEIIRGRETSDAVVAVTAALATRLDKYPVVVEDVPGFLVNRILTPYLNTATRLYTEGYTIVDIDKAATGFGLPMGPMRLLDEVGLDVVAHVSKVMEAGYGARMTAPEIAPKMVALGRKGRKGGKGFYDYEADGNEVPSPLVRSMLELKNPAKPSPNRTWLGNLMVAALINEAVRCLDEGVAGQPGVEAAQQIDLATVMGMGFPPFRGGILHYTDTIGTKAAWNLVQQTMQALPGVFEPWSGLRERAERGVGVV